MPQHFAALLARRCGGRVRNATSNSFDQEELIELTRMLVRTIFELVCILAGWGLLILSIINLVNARPDWALGLFGASPTCQGWVRPAANSKSAA